MSAFGDIGRLRQEKYKNSLQFSQSFSVLPKPAGAQGAHAVMGFRGFAQVRANPFLECQDD